MAFLFPLFLLSNFQSPIQQNLPVHKITHKAPRVPLNLIYIGTCILGLAWVFARNGSAWHQTKAALANQSGDIAWLFHDKKQAEFDYHKAMGHSKLNGQSSFRLANLAIESHDLEAAAYYLSTSQLKHPNYASFVGLSNIFQKENQIFQALFTLQKGNQLFPNNLQILTQLAHTYESLNLIDSAQYFYQKAALSNPDNSLAQANLLYATKRDVIIKPTEDAAIQANKLAISLKKGTSSSDTPYNTNFKPSGDLRDWAYLYNAMLFYKAKQPVIESGQWIKQGYANTIFPELQLLDAWQDYYHNKPLRALEKLSLLVDSDASGKLDAYKNIMEFWHKSMRMPHAPVKLKDLKSALRAIEMYPFQADILQEAILILNANKNEKQAYEASLHAARWNEDDAVFQWIYALQALKIGEIDYAKEAMNQLLSQDPKLFLASKPIFERELQQAIGRQKF
jgi:tetratricopeptide (TPR) repeat protein